ncbi:uncharacterized protein LOC135692302 isoform X2 [Rhopilema esculentum]|uniref:uncharacterized protein LOC135692302 isoform X2 n=1 Tax=Rhopilema esculentum TaxID=499914 RepID=UPI0031D4569C
MFSTRAGAKDITQQPQKKKRGCGRKEYISKQSKQRVFDKRQEQQLRSNLINWLKRTNMPVVALSLSSDLTVNYIGAEWFEDFVKDPYIRDKFVDVAVKGLKKFYEHSERNETTEIPVNMETESTEGISLDVGVKQKLLADDVLRHDVHQKSMLIGHIVRRKGLTSKTCWLPENKPTWFWPESVKFRSPNCGPDRMKVSEMDLVLAACIKELKRIEEENNLRDSQSNDGGHEVEEMDEVDEVEEMEEYGEMEERQVPSTVGIENTAVAEVMEEREVGTTNVGHRNERIKFIIEKMKDCRWNDPNCNDVHALLGMMEEDLWILERVAPFVPKHVTFGSYCLTLKSSDTNYWLRHQVPSSVARSLDPFLVLQDGNGLYRAASLALFNIIDFWPTLRFLSMKYGIENFGKVMRQLKEVDGPDVFVGNSNEDFERKTKKEILFTALPNRKCMTLHLVLLSISMGITVNSYSMAKSRDLRIDHENSIGEVNLLWVVDKNGLVTDKVYPLLNTCDGNDNECGASFYCVRPADATSRVKCIYCLRRFHPFCVSLSKKGPDSSNTNWTCGCDISHADLPIIDRFSSMDKVKQLLESFSSEIKRHISNALKYHWAHAMEVAKEDRRVDEMDSCWLFPGNPVACLSIPAYIARLASADKRFFRIPIEDRGTVVKNFLLADVVAFLVHRLASISLLCARRLVNNSAKHEISV